MSKSALTVLREARELISDPKRWTRGAFARAQTGYPIGPLEENAVCFCAVGAVRRVSAARGLCPSEMWGGPMRALEVASYRLFKSSHVPTVNDFRAHEVVLRMFDTAIAAEEAEAQV